MKHREEIKDIRLRLNALWYDLAMFTGLIFCSFGMLVFQKMEYYLFFTMVGLCHILLIQILELIEMRKIKYG